MSHRRPSEAGSCGFQVFDFRTSGEFLYIIFWQTNYSQLIKLRSIDRVNIEINCLCNNSGPRTGTSGMASAPVLITFI